MSRVRMTPSNESQPKMSTYRDAGVDIEAGEQVVDRIKPLVRQTFTPGVLTDIGAFGAFFQPDFRAYDEPVLISSVDGVGTKLKVAVLAGIHDTVGRDLVNHCVNDIAVCGAKPLFFLDYYATGVLDPDVAVQVVSGFSAACVENECALIGGETAEMPDIYAKGDYDLAGTVVGVVDRHRIVDGSRIEAGDELIGFPSTGLHTNGYSLARKVLFSRYSIQDRPSELAGESIGESLLRVHRSYLRLIQILVDSDIDVRGLVHVTGGGIPGNTARVLPRGLTADVAYESWTIPPIFKLIQATGSVPDADMRRTFNLGIGLILIVKQTDTGNVRKLCDSLGEHPLRIGTVRAEPPE